MHLLGMVEAKPGRLQDYCFHIVLCGRVDEWMRGPALIIQSNFISCSANVYITMTGLTRSSLLH